MVVARPDGASHRVRSHQVHRRTTPPAPATRNSTPAVMLWTAESAGRAESGEGTGTDAPRRVDRGLFYTVKGRQYPSVTTVLDIIAKPALGSWYAKEERRYFEAAMLEILSRPGARDPEYVLTAVAEAVSGVKAADRAKQQAASIGTAMHAGIEGALRTQLG